MSTRQTFELQWEQVGKPTDKSFTEKILKISKLNEGRVLVSYFLSDTQAAPCDAAFAEEIEYGLKDGEIVGIVPVRPDELDYTLAHMYAHSIDVRGIECCQGNEEEFFNIFHIKPRELDRLSERKTRIIERERV